MSTVNEEGGDALADYAMGLSEPKEDIWKYVADYDPEWDGCARGGSANLDMIGNACHLVWGTANEQNEMARAWSKFFDENKLRFQRTEQFSVIYSCWHVLPVLAVYRWASKTGALALQGKAGMWLLNWWSVCSLSGTKLKGGRTYVPICGERSSGTPLDNYYGHHALWSEANGEPWNGREDALAGTGDINDFVGRCIVGFSKEIRETAAPVVGKGFPEVLRLSPQYTARMPAYIYRADHGVAFWWGLPDPAERASLNGNTGPIMCLLVQNGEVMSGPVSGGEHYRQKPSHANAWYDRATNELHWRWDEATPSSGFYNLNHMGKPWYLIEMKDGKWTDILGASAGTPQVPPTPGGPREYDILADQLVNILIPKLVKLNESNTTQQERDYLASELRTTADRLAPKRVPLAGKKPWWQWGKD